MSNLELVLRLILIVLAIVGAALTAIFVAIYIKNKKKDKRKNFTIHDPDKLLNFYKDLKWTIFGFGAGTIGAIIVLYLMTL